MHYASGPLHWYYSSCLAVEHLSYACLVPALVLGRIHHPDERDSNLFWLTLLQLPPARNVLSNPYIWGMAITYFFIYVVRQVLVATRPLPPCRHCILDPWRILSLSCPRLLVLGVYCYLFHNTCTST